MTTDIQNIDANITDGVLEVVVQKKTNVGPRIIKISITTNEDLKKKCRWWRGKVSPLSWESHWEQNGDIDDYCQR